VLISEKEFEQRLVNAKRKMEEQGLGALIVYSNCKLPGNVQYLSNYAPIDAGYQSVGGFKTIIWGDVVCVVEMEKEPVLLTNCPWMASQVREVSSLTDIRVTFDYAGGISETLSHEQKKIGIDGWQIFPAPIHERLRKMRPNATFEESMILEELRMVKSSAELALLKKASKLTVEGMKAGIRAIKQGATELDVALACETVMERGNPERAGNTDRLAGNSLIGSGRRTSIGGVAPIPTRKKIRKGDLVVMDITGEYAGYAGDISRGKVLGRPSKEQVDLFESVMQLQNACLKAIRPGVKHRELQDVANRVGRELGYGQYVVPLVSHGIGLEIHERPDSGLEETPIMPDMVMSCEPAICTPALGLRIEDTVRVTEAGYEILTKCEKTLEL
jgi:Xaa-Pro aminopeptidase